MFTFKRAGSRYYRGKYRLSNGPRWYDVALRVEQKELADAKLQKLVREKEQELLGWLPPKPLRDAAQSPITEHLAEYVEDLAAQGFSKKHVALSRNRVQRLCNECGWRLLRDITPDGFTRWRARQSFAPKTCNEYLGLTSAFLNWMENAGRIAKNPWRPLANPKPVGGNDALAGLLRLSSSRSFWLCQESAAYSTRLPLTRGFAAVRLRRCGGRTFISMPRAPTCWPGRPRRRTRNKQHCRCSRNSWNC